MLVIAATCSAVSAMFSTRAAYKGLEVSQLMLRASLYEKRYGVYKSTQRLLSKVVQDLSIDLGDIFEFQTAVQDSQFLFDKDVHAYLLEVRRRAIELRSAVEGMRQTHCDEQERQKYATKQHENAMWLADQLDEIPTRLSPLLEVSRGKENFFWSQND
ncbi:MAG: hypothetical protein AAFR16_10120 [Pseudomonadota bacterium]